MDNHFGGVIWTNHALDRLRERGIKQGDAWATWNRPEKSYKANLHKGDAAWRYYRTYGDERIEVVAKKNEKGEWVIISVWSDPVFASKNTKKITISKKYKVSFWRWLYNLAFKV
jgi:hypothetical protein